MEVVSAPSEATHEIDAFYSSDGDQWWKVLSCSCGWSTGMCISWQDAGSEMDGHLEQVKEA